MLLKLAGLTAQGIVWLAMLLPIAWGALAIWFDGPAERWLAGVVAGAFVLACVACMALLRPFGRGVAAAVTLIAVVIAWWSLLEPSNDRNWTPDVARTPWATLEGNRLTVHNVRNFQYRSSDADFVEHWDTRTYDLDKLTGFDMFTSDWGLGVIVHTIASFEFSDGKHLAVSIETRKEKGEEYSAVKGFFRQFELYYVVADERDVIGVRAAHRGETVRLYRMRAPREQARAMLMSYVDTINRLHGQPFWYNALTHNCTTMIRWHTQQIAAGRPWDWRILANGHLDEMAYERGTVNTSLPFAELRARSDVTGKSKTAHEGEDFAALIREGLPERPKAAKQ